MSHRGQSRVVTSIGGSCVYIHVPYCNRIYTHVLCITFEDIRSIMCSYVRDVSVALSRSDVTVTLPQRFENDVNITS